MRAKPTLYAALAALIVGLASVAWAQTAIELKKEIFLKYKKAQAEGKELGEAGKEYQAGDEALKKGMDEEAVEHFKRAKELWPAETN